MVSGTSAPLPRRGGTTELLHNLPNTTNTRHGAAPGAAARGWLPTTLRRPPAAARAFASNGNATATSTSSQQQQQQQQRQQLDWLAQHRAATIAAWSGLCYLQDVSELEARLAARGMSLVASGRNDFTSWFVADGSINAAAFARRSLERRAAPAAPGSSSNGNGASSSSSGGSSSAAVDDLSAACAAAAAGAARRERFVLLRGVQWAAPEMNSTKMSMSLMRIWPKPLVAGRGDIVAHDGVAEMATAMFDQLRPYLDHAEDAGGCCFYQRAGDADVRNVCCRPAAADDGGTHCPSAVRPAPTSSPPTPPGIPVVFGGHSLGGSLSKLLLSLYRLNSRKPPGGQPAPTCYTFGSPPVMAHVDGGGGDKVLGLLGLTRAQCR